ncbi:hypothetical protein MTO96_004562 [Rhipicephalus appendiculatus]
MKVHCWNEVHGCQFEGTMEHILRHYEKECTFHTVECLRCGGGVLHNDLSKHYVDGCTTRVSSACAQKTSPESTAATPSTENKSSESAASTHQDVIATLEEVKTLLRYPRNGEQPIAIASDTNELPDQHQGATSTAAARGVGSSAESMNAGSTEVTGPTPSNLLQEPGSQRNTTAEASDPSSSRSEGSTSLQPVDFFNNLPAQVLAGLRELSLRDYTQHVLTGGANRNVKCRLRKIRFPPTTECVWRKVRGEIVYDLVIENIPDVTLAKGESTTLCKLTAVLTMDAYFNVEVFGNGDFLSVHVLFYGTLEGSQCLAPSLNVDAYHRFRMGTTPLECSLELDRGFDLDLVLDRDLDRTRLFPLVSLGKDPDRSLSGPGLLSCLFVFLSGCSLIVSLWPLLRDPPESL